MSEIDGKWKRPVYSKADPKFADDWNEITSVPIPEWLLK